MWPNFKKLFSSKRKPRPRRPIHRAQVLLEQLECRLAPSINVPSFRYDIGGTGVNANENQLTPANVQVGSFGKLFTTTVDGQVYAEPLVETGVTIAAGPNTGTGATGTHDVVFVATEHDSLYAIDASVTGGAVLWQRSFTDTTSGYTGTLAGTNINNTLNATTITSVPNGDLGTTDINPEVGITGTPVIDSSTNTLYVVVTTKEIINGNAHYVQRLHAINITDGTDLANPFLIGDTTNGNTNNTSIYVYGTGDGSVTDPYNGTGNPVVQFNALTQNERGALSLVNNEVYVEWASHGDNGPYHGWVAKWNISNLTTSGMQLTGIFCTSPNDGLSGIWGGGGSLAFEADGSAFYFETGNGSGGPPVLNANGFPTDANYNEAVVKVVADPTSTPTNQNPNGWGLKAADFFIPYNVSALDNTDDDLGSGAPMILPDSAGIPGHPHLMVAAGKEGKIYLIDRDNMGKYDPNNDDVLNSVANGNGNNTPPVQLGGSLSTAAYYNGTIYWTSGYDGPGYAYAINANGTLTVTSQTADNDFGYLPGSVIVSANNSTDGIVWMIDRTANELHAYDATTLGTELWNSGQKVGGGDALGAAVKFAVPTVANGEVFIGTTDSLVVYSLTQAATAVPQTPVLTATALSGSSINLTWTDSSVVPNNATGYAIEESTDGINFTQVATAPAGATSIAIGGLQPLTTYYFQIFGYNSFGNSLDSAIVNATTTNLVPLINFSGGFASAASMLTNNGSAALNGSNLELTNNGATEAGSSFYTSPVDITEFNTQFTFQLSAGANTADGFTFTIQGVGPNALGMNGGGLGYGANQTGGTGGINQSVAVKFDLYSNNGEGTDSTGLYTDGAPPTNVGSIDLTSTGIDLHSGDVFQVNMSYDGTTLMVTIKDTQTGQSAMQSYPIDIPSVVGNNTAYVGFTGGTGGQTSTQNILTWTYEPSAAVSPNAPSGLGATPASATSVNLVWTNNATNQIGFHLDRSNNPNFTSFITETLPASPNAFTDTATGLAPGDTFYYRLRSFNAAGDSSSSNPPVSVTIPLAPAKPSNQIVTGVTSNEIDISWQDNAGHTATGYHILRAINHGSFVQIASLPLTSRTPPSTYIWSDTNLAPGSFYEYHIIAYNISGNNDFAGVNATTLTNAPTGLKATAGSKAITLNWTATPAAQSYNIYRGTAAGQEGTTPLATGITATTYLDSAIQVTGQSYFYTVTAVNANVAPLPNESAPSNEATPNASAAPTNLTANPLTANNGPASVSLTWTATAGAAAYHVYRSTNPGGETSPALVTGVTGTSYTDTTPSYGTIYYYTVTAVNAGGESSQSNETNAGILSTLPTFSWNAFMGATQYDVWLSDLTVGVSPVLRNTNVQGTTWNPPAPLLVNHTYRWWERALNNTIPLSPWSTGLTFVVSPLNTPTLSGPVGTIDFASTATLTPTFTWSAVSGAASYDVWVNDLTSGKSQVVRQTTTNTSLPSPTVLTLGDTYEWWVRAQDTQVPPDLSSWGSGTTFSIVLAYPTPVGPSGSLPNATPTFTWNAVAGADFYDVWVNDLTTSTSQVLRTPLTGSQVVTGTSWTAPTALNPGDNYMWWVRSLTKSGGASLWSTGIPYTVALLSMPAAPFSPSGSLPNAKPTFTWNAITGADYYDVWVNDLTTSTSQVLRTPLTGSQVVTGTSWTAPTALNPGDNYMWWVRGLSNNGTVSPWSVGTTFTVTPLSMPAPPFSPSGSLPNGTMPTFTWNAVTNADYYDVWVNDLTGGIAQVVRDKNVPSTSLPSPITLTVGHTYTWWVRAYSDNGDFSPWSLPVNFTVIS